MTTILILRIRVRIFRCKSESDIERKKLSPEKFEKEKEDVTELSAEEFEKKKDDLAEKIF